MEFQNMADQPNIPAAKNDLQNKIETWGLKLPLALYVLGFFVHNVYLSRYSFFELEILQTRYIYTGFIALSFISVILILVLLRLDLSNFANNLTILNFFSWAARLPIFSLFIYFLLNNPGTLIHGYLGERLGTTNAQSIVTSLQLFSLYFFGGLLFVSFGPIIKTDLPVILLVKKIIAFLSIPLIVFVYYISSYYQPLSDIFHFLILPFVLVFFSLAGLSDSEKGIVYHSEVLQNNESALSKKIIRFIYIAFLLFQAMNIVTSYSKNIYPLLSPNYGGARPVPVTITIKTETIRTRLLDESNTWLITQETDTSNVIKLRTSDIKKIAIEKR
jgi:hypothetical protein